MKGNSVISEKFKEQIERSQDPEGFTLKERSEWEQLLNEERIIRQKESINMPPNQLSTKELSEVIALINIGPAGHFNLWLDRLIEIYSVKKDDVRKIDLLTFELSCARLVILFVISQIYYYERYPHRNRLYESFLKEVENQFRTMFRDECEFPLSLFHIRLSSYIKTYESTKDPKAIFERFVQQAHFHFSHCLFSSNPVTFEVTPDMDIMRLSLPIMQAKLYCAELVDHLVSAAKMTFELYEITD